MSASNGHSHDAGIESELRRRPCIKRILCTLELDHEGACVELPRRKYERPGWDLRTPDPKGWRKKP